MLVIKRNNGQSVYIGNDIQIVILDASHGWAKIGIEAPKEIQITRPDAKSKTKKERGAA